MLGCHQVVTKRMSDYGFSRDFPGSTGAVGRQRFSPCRYWPLFLIALPWAGSLNAAVRPDERAERAASPTPEPQSAVEPPEPAEVAPRRMYIREYRVLGAHELPKIEVEEAVYGFLGPGRTPDDVEQARAALEKAYPAEGLQAGTARVPPR